MDQAQFWKLIEDAKRESGGDCEEQVELLQQSLAELPPVEIVEFDTILMGLWRSAYRYDLWGATYLINGGCSDDGFAYFRCWLIAQGQAIFEHALRDPDSLADVIEPDFADAECEELLYPADCAYRDKTGKEPPEPDRSERPVGVDPEPAGKRWEEEDLDAMFPRLVAKIEG